MYGPTRPYSDAKIDANVHRYMYESSVGPVPARIYFCTVVGIGSIFLLNVVLAIVSDCYDQSVHEAINDTGLEQGKGEAALTALKYMQTWVSIGSDTVRSGSQRTQRIGSGRRSSLLKRRIAKPPSGRIRERLRAGFMAFKTRLDALKQLFHSNIAVNDLVVHEKLGVGWVRRWDKARQKWNIVFLGHHRVREAATLAATLDESGPLPGFEAHNFTTITAQKQLLLVPSQAFRRAAMEAFQSPLHQGFVSLCVLGNAIALSAYHYNHDVFITNFVQGLWDRCHKVLPTLAQATFANPGNYTLLWEWRRAVRSSANISIDCTDFLTTGAQGVSAMPAQWETVLDWTIGAFSILFLFDLLLGLVGAVSTQPKAQFRATLDAVISVLTVIGIGIPFFSLFAVLRLYTFLFRLVKFFRMRQLERILLGLGDAMSAIVPLLIFVGFFVFFFAILGVQFFGPSSLAYISPAGVLIPTANWASMWPNQWGYGAFMTVVQILTGENWNNVMFQVMTDVSPAAVVYFLVLNCFGVCVPP